MRPLKLTIAGFGPYADAQELDFGAAASLICSAPNTHGQRTRHMWS